MGFYDDYGPYGSWHGSPYPWYYGRHPYPYEGFTEVPATYDKRVALQHKTKEFISSSVPWLKVKAERDEEFLTQVYYLDLDTKTFVEQSRSALKPVTDKLQENIDKEEAERIKKDSELKAAIDLNTNNLTQEINRAKQAEENINNSVEDIKKRINPPTNPERLYLLEYKDFSESKGLNVDFKNEFLTIKGIKNTGTWSTFYSANKVDNGKYVVRIRGNLDHLYFYSFNNDFTNKPISDKSVITVDDNFKGIGVVVRENTPIDTSVKIELYDEKAEFLPEINVFGDSISIGLSSYNEPEEHFDKPWPSVMSSCYPSVIKNSSVSGRKISGSAEGDLIGQISKADVSSSDIAIIAMGTNDYNDQDDLESVKNSLRQAIENIYNKNRSIFIVGILPHNVLRNKFTPKPNEDHVDGYKYTNGQLTATVLDYAKALASVYDEFYIPYIDWSHSPVITTRTYDKYTWDGIHPNEEGHKVIGKRVAEWLKLNIGG